VVDVDKGKLRLRKWPNKRGVPGSPIVRAMNSWLASAVQLSKHMDPYTASAAIAQAGGTGLYPRDLVIKAMAGNIADLVFLSGQIITKRRYFLEPVMYQGARVQRVSNLSIPANTQTVIAWEQPIIDTAALFSLAAPTRLTIPAGVTRINALAGFYVTTGAINNCYAAIRRNGSIIIGGFAAQAANTKNFGCTTGPVNVAAGDYIEAICLVQTVGTLQARIESYFACDLIEVA
jgi:hypothetical protein